MIQADNNKNMENKLTFGELKLGDRFISFPLDGDNSGHGGYKGDHYIFQKSKKGSTYFALRLMDANHSSMPDSMYVIKVK